jgi:hypothetical protein
MIINIEFGINEINVLKNSKYFYNIFNIFTSDIVLYVEISLSDQ